MHKIKDEDDEAVNKVPRIAMGHFFMSEEDPNANKSPIWVMMDENAGDRYAKATSRKGVGCNREMDWFFKDSL